MLRDMETSDFAEQLFVAIKHGHSAIEVIWEGDVFVLAEPRPTVFEIDIEHVGGPAELLHYFGLVVDDAHDVGLVAAEAD